MLCRWSTVNQSHLQQYVTSQFLQIDDACSAYLSIIDPHPETSSALEELCFMVMGFLQKPQSSVLHPLLQLVPQLHERRLKRYKADSAFQSSSLSNMASLAIYKEWP
uniref:Neuromedin U n=1 Tax=Terrapene triunguis TaxID=2587831 RepID=A0A674IWG4_9SAUR